MDDRFSDMSWRRARPCGGNTGDQSGEGEESCVEVAVFEHAV